MSGVHLNPDEHERDAAEVRPHSWCPYWAETHKDGICPRLKGAHEALADLMREIQEEHEGRERAERVKNTAVLISKQLINWITEEGGCDCCPLHNIAANRCSMVCRLSCEEEKEQELAQAHERNIKLREDYKEAAYEARELWGVTDKLQQARKEIARNQEIFKGIRDIFGYGDEPVDLVTYIAEDIGKLRAALVFAERFIQESIAFAWDDYKKRKGYALSAEKRIIKWAKLRR